MSNFKLYILVRTDLASMTPGRACAQTAHAIDVLHGRPDLDFPEYKYNAWKAGNQFGTTIILAVPDVQTIVDRVTKARQLDILADWVFDPTYPIKDGACTHLLNILTVGFMLLDTTRASHRVLIEDLPLY